MTSLFICHLFSNNRVFVNQITGSFSLWKRTTKKI